MAAKRGGAGHTGGEGCTPYNGLYRAAPPERGTFFRLQVYERVRVSLVEVYEGQGNLSFGEKAQKGEQMNFKAL